MWCIDQFYILFWILPGSGTAYCLSWRYLHWLDIEISYRVFDTDQFILSKWWEPTAGNSWRRVWVSWEISDGENISDFEFWDIEMHWHCEDMTIFAHLICLRICVVRCFGIVRTIPTSSSSWSTDHLSGLRLCILSSSETTLLVAYEDDIVSVRLWSSLTRTTLSFHDFILHCGLPITVVERLQRYNCIWLTYIVNVEQNILFPIEVWS